MFCTKDSFKIFEGCFHSFIAAGLNVTQEKILTPPHTRESCLISYKGMNFVCLCDRNKKKGGRLNSLYPFDIFFAKKHTSCYYSKKYSRERSICLISQVEVTAISVNIEDSQFSRQVAKCMWWTISVLYLFVATFSKGFWVTKPVETYFSEPSNWSSNFY